MRLEIDQELGRLEGAVYCFGYEKGYFHSYKDIEFSLHKDRRQTITKM